VNMAQAFVSIGSNVDPEKNVKQAIRLLKERVRIKAVSTVYLTAALGPSKQQDFYNCIVEIETSLPPAEFKAAVLRQIEAGLGRIRTSHKYDARTIDLDLILYDDLILASEAILLPDPDILKRPFLFIPLLELRPEIVLPGSAIPLAKRVKNPASGMRALNEYTEHLRKELIHA